PSVEVGLVGGALTALQRYPVATRLLVEVTELLPVAALPVSRALHEHVAIRWHRPEKRTEQALIRIVRHLGTMEVIYAHSATGTSTRPCGSDDVLRSDL